MTDPSDRLTAEALLRSRFPESEGWRVSISPSPVATTMLARRPAVDVAVITRESESAEEAALRLIAAWDAALASDPKVKALVEAARAQMRIQACDGDGEAPQSFLDGDGVLDVSAGQCDGCCACAGPLLEAALAAFDGEGT